MSRKDCKLYQKLAIGYNGRFVEKKTKKLVGTLLTQQGKVYAREEADEKWIRVSTPDVFLFRDNKCKTTYVVDICRELIDVYHAPHGRVLDVTDRKIYELDCEQRVPIVALGNPTVCKPEYITRVDTIAADVVNFTFPVIGNCPEVLCDSQVQAQQVTWLNGTATVPASVIEPGTSQVLLYQAERCGCPVTVAQILTRQLPVLD